MSQHGRDLVMPIGEDTESPAEIVISAIRRKENNGGTWSWAGSQGSVGQGSESQRDTCPEAEEKESQCSKGRLWLAGSSQWVVKRQDINR